MSDGQAILLTVAGTVAGAGASWFFSRWYYRRSSVDLDAALQPLTGDSQKLLRATNAVARMLEQAGIGKPTYDAAGNLTGVVVSVSGHDSASATESATVTIIEAPRYDRQHEQPPTGEKDSRDV